MHQTYTTWSFYGMNVFEFGHNYASRFVSLFAMFFMALIMFEILPELHRHIVRLLKPLGIMQPKKKVIKLSPKAAVRCSCAILCLNQLDIRQLPFHLHQSFQEVD